MTHIKIDDDCIHIITQNRMTEKLRQDHTTTRIKLESIYGYTYDDVDMCILFFLKYMTTPHKLQYFNTVDYAEAKNFIINELKL